jgi:hypothetical protein
LLEANLVLRRGGGNMACVLRHNLEEHETKSEDDREGQNDRNCIGHRMTGDQNFPDEPAQDINEIDGQYRHDQWNKEMLTFAKHIKSGDQDSKRQRHREESTQITHALGALINFRVHFGI